MACLSTGISHCGAMTSVRQKNFKKVPDWVHAAWDRFLLRRATSDEIAGPIALWIVATRFNAKEWSDAVDDYWKQVDDASGKPPVKHPLADKPAAAAAGGSRHRQPRTRPET